MCLRNNRRPARHTQFFHRLFTTAGIFYQQKNTVEAHTDTRTRQTRQKADAKGGIRMTSFTPYDPLDPRYTQNRTGDTPYAAPWGGQTAPSPKPKKRRGKARAAGLIAGCAAVALVAGVGGGYLGSRIPAESGSSSSNGGSTVLYQSVSNKTGTGELSVADVAAKAAIRWWRSPPARPPMPGSWYRPAPAAE